MEEFKETLKAIRRCYEVYRQDVFSCNSAWNSERNRLVFTALAQAIALAYHAGITVKKDSMRYECFIDLPSLTGNVIKVFWDLDSEMSNTIDVDKCLTEFIMTH